MIWDEDIHDKYNLIVTDVLTGNAYYYTDKELENTANYVTDTRNRDSAAREKVCFIVNVVTSDRLVQRAASTPEAIAIELDYAGFAFDFHYTWESAINVIQETGHRVIAIRNPEGYRSIEDFQNKLDNELAVYRDYYHETDSKYDRLCRITLPLIESDN